MRKPHRSHQNTITILNPAVGGSRYTVKATVESLIRRGHAQWGDDAQTCILLLTPAMVARQEVEMQKDAELDAAILRERGDVNWHWARRPSGPTAMPVMQARAIVGVSGSFRSINAGG